MRGPGFRRRLLGAEDGVTIVEFALLAPVLLMMILGIADMAQVLWMQSVLQGVVQKAARDSTLQAYNTPSGEATLDARVTAMVKSLAPQATVPTPVRRYYKDYAAASARTAEPWSDTDKDGTCDHNESYTDTNSNGTWDADGANAGGGGAQDKAVYTVNISYPRLFPMDRLIGLPGTVKLSASTVLANQPYDDQATYTTGTTMLHCP